MATNQKMGCRLLLWGLVSYYLACILTLSGTLCRWSLVFELASHFKVQYATCIGICLPFLAIMKAGRLLLMGIVCLTLNLGHIPPWYFDKPASFPNAETANNLRIILANVYAGNR